MGKRKNVRKPTYKPPPDLPAIPKLKYKKPHPNQTAFEFDANSHACEGAHNEPPPKKGTPK